MIICRASLLKRITCFCSTVYILVICIYFIALKTPALDAERPGRAVSDPHSFILRTTRAIPASNISTYLHGTSTPFRLIIKCKCQITSIESTIFLRIGDQSAQNPYLIICHWHTLRLSKWSDWRYIFSERMNWFSDFSYLLCGLQTTQQLCRWLDSKEIPYLYVSFDAMAMSRKQKTPQILHRNGYMLIINITAQM